MSKLNRKLSRGRFPGISPLMAAIVGYVVGESLADIDIAELKVGETENLVYVRQAGTVGFDGIPNSEDLRNWNRLMDAAGLTPEERKRAAELFRQKSEAVPGGDALA